MVAPSGPEQVLFKSFVSCIRAAGPPSSQMEGESLVSVVINQTLSADKVDCRSSDKILTPLVHLNLHFEEKNEMPVSILCLYFPVCVCVLKLNTRHDLGTVATHTQCTFTQYSIT